MRIKFINDCFLEIDYNLDFHSADRETKSKKFFKSGEIVDCEVFGLGVAFPNIEFRDGSVAYCVNAGSFRVLRKKS